ncbi:hypothetical protein Agub_g6544 [Astrephomene gubernaculifera]|uniref:Uncharacterized protein n=1 Tax=Astrephomene gubernaculifera TaxID=47775 RepID=A0AAD3DNL7_9CHLO|nr:hypothetical protein Agub_g6544 [Astrephomene gubernaculifera]
MLACKSLAHRVAHGDRRGVASPHVSHGLKHAKPRSRFMAPPLAAFTSDNPVRQTLSQVASNVYKVSAMFSQPEPGLTPLWAAVKRLDLSAVKAALNSGASPDERDATSGDTPLLMIARAGHYKYPPSEIPAALVRAGADLEARDKAGLTALQISLLSGWQNIAELLISSGASTAGVAEVKPRLTCPDCKRLVAKYNL